MLKTALVVVAGISLVCPLTYAGDSNQPPGRPAVQTSSPQTPSEDLPAEATVDCFYEINRASELCQDTDRSPSTTPHTTTGELEVKKLVVNGTELAYVEEGRGEIVVFVHGTSGDWRNWETLRPMIAEKYHFVAYSRRYHYPNAWTDDGEKNTLDQHVEDLAAFIRTLHTGKVHVVGGSYGARIAGYLALKYPELLRSVVMSDPSLIAPTSPESREASAAFQKELARAKAAAVSGDDRQAAVVIFDAVLDEPGAFDKASTDRQQRWLANARTLKTQFTGTPPAPISCEQLAALKVPVLIMSGERSRANFRYGDEKLLSCLPKVAEFASVANAPHMWYPVNPADGSAKILAFISKH